MEKDFKQWCAIKERIHEGLGTALFHEREIWWCSLGANIGDEQDGGEHFLRPVVVLKKFNLNACLTIPLIGRLKEGKYYFPVGKVEERDATAVLSQIRFIDRKRLVKKICTLDQNTFESLIQSVVRANFAL